MKSLLFLDFDGVMNRITPAGYDPAHPRLNEGRVELVQVLAEWFDAGVVISSSWREEYSLKQLKHLLSVTGATALAERVFDVTPIHERVPKRRHLRAAEIAEWIQRHEDARGLPYIIIDDSAKHAFPAAHFVNTRGAQGFQRHDFDKSVELFMAQGLMR